jgi:hypothetical protein
VAGAVGKIPIIFTEALFPNLLFMGVQFRPVDGLENAATGRPVQMPEPDSGSTPPARAWWSGHPVFRVQRAPPFVVLNTPPPPAVAITDDLLIDDNIDAAEGDARTGRHQTRH